MKKNIVLLFLLLCPLVSMADVENSLLLHLTTGKPIILMLENNPIILFEGDETVVESQTCEIRYKSTDIKKITYDYIDPSSVNDVVIPCFFSIKGNSLEMNGITPNSRVSICSLDGKLIISSISNSNGYVEIILPETGKGVFIIKTDTTNFKIVKL